MAFRPGSRWQMPLQVIGGGGQGRKLLDLEIDSLLAAAKCGSKIPPDTPTSLDIKMP